MFNILFLIFYCPIDGTKYFAVLLNPLCNCAIISGPLEIPTVKVKIQLRHMVHVTIKWDDWG